MMLLEYFHDSDIWAYSQKVTFDGINRQITINSSESIIDIKTDMYSAWKQWVFLRDNEKYLPAFRSIGGDPIDAAAGIYAGDLYFLTNGWQIVVDHAVSFVGVVYNDTVGVNPFIILPGGGVQSTVSNLTQTVQIGGSTAPTVQQIRQEIDSNSAKLITILNSLMALPVPPTAPTVANAVWNAQATNYTASGSTGLMLNQVKADTATIVVNESSLTAMMNLMLQYERGRTKIDIPSATLTVFAVDGTTPIQVFNLLDHNGMPSVAEVAERVPTM